MRRFLIILAMMMLLGAGNLLAQEITPGKEIDLGLPSGTIWAAWNVGATSPEEYGDYYAWGETEVKSDYSGYSYKYWTDSDSDGYFDVINDYHYDDFINIGTNISITKYDVANQKWGSSWRMPTNAEFNELISQCSWDLITYKGKDGVKVTGPNGNSIFLPAAGFRNNTSLYGEGGIGYYWSATLYEGEDYYDAYALCFRNGYLKGYFIDGFRRDGGYSVRPVKKGEEF